MKRNFPPNARMVALEVLKDIHGKQAYASLALQNKLRINRLLPNDRRLATNIVYTTLERQIQIDFVLDGLMDRPTNDIVQRDILRMSACQILFFDRVPDSAAVNEGVKLAHQLGMGAASGFLNAVLRNLVRQKDQIAWPSREDDVEQYLHVMGSMPMWLVEKLISVYGSATAEEIIMHEKAEHSMVLRPNMLKLSDEEFASLLSQKDWHWKRGLRRMRFWFPALQT